MSKILSSIVSSVKSARKVSRDQKLIANPDSPESLDIPQKSLDKLILSSELEEKTKQKFRSILTFNQIKNDLETKSALEKRDFAAAIAFLGDAGTPEVVKKGLEKLITDNLKKLKIKDLKPIQADFPVAKFPSIASSIVTTLTEKQKTLSETKARVITKIRAVAAAIDPDPENVKKYFKKLGSTEQRNFITHLFFFKRAEAKVPTNFAFIDKVLEVSKEGSGVTSSKIVITNYIREIDASKVARFIDELGEIPLEKKIEILSLYHTLDKEKTLILLEMFGEEAFKTYIKTLAKEEVKKFLENIPEREKKKYTEQALLERSKGKPFAEIREEVESYGNYPKEGEFGKIAAFAMDGLKGEELQNRQIEICTDPKTTYDEVKSIIDVVATAEKDKFLLKLLKDHTLDKEKTLILLNNLGEEAFKTYIKTLRKEQVRLLLDNIPKGQKEKYTQDALLARSQGKSFAEIREEVKLYGNYPKETEFAKIAAFAMGGLKEGELQKRKIEICADPETTYDEVRFIIGGVAKEELDKFLLELLEKRTEGKDFKKIQEEAEKIGVTEDKIFEFAAKVALKGKSIEAEKNEYLSQISEDIEFKDKLKLAEIAQIQFENSGQIGIKTPQERGAFLRHLGNKEDADIGRLASQVDVSDCKSFAFIHDLNPELASALAKKALKAGGLDLEERISLKSIEKKGAITKFELAEEILKDKVKEGKFNIGEVQGELTKKKLTFSDETSGRKLAILYAEVNGLKVEGKTFYENFTGFFDKIFSTQKSREEKLKKYKTGLEKTFSPEKKIFWVKGDPFSPELAKLIGEMQSRTTKSLRKMIQPQGGITELHSIDDLSRMHHMSEAIRIVLEERGAKITLNQTIEEYIDKEVASFLDLTNKKKKDAALKAFEALKKFDKIGEKLSEALRDRLSLIEQREDYRNVKRYLYDTVEDKLEEIHELTPPQKLIRQVQIFETRLEEYLSAEETPVEASFRKVYKTETNKSVAEKALHETLKRIIAIDREIGEVLNKVRTLEDLTLAKREIGLILYEKTEQGKIENELIQQQRKSAAREKLSGQLPDISRDDSHGENTIIKEANVLNERKLKLEQSLRHLEGNLQTISSEDKSRKIFLLPYRECIESENIEDFAKTLHIENPSEEMKECLRRYIKVCKAKIACDNGSQTETDLTRVSLYDKEKSEISDILSSELEKLTPKWEKAMDDAIDVVEGRRGSDERKASAAVTFFEESVNILFQSIKGVLESTSGGVSRTSSTPASSTKSTKQGQSPTSLTK